MKEKLDVIQYDGEFTLQNNDTFFTLIDNLDGEYMAKTYTKIFNTNLYNNLEYKFKYNELLQLFENYAEKYSTIKTCDNYFGINCSYREYYDGVYELDFNALKYENIKETFNDDNTTITLNISVSAIGKLYDDAWTDKKGIYEVFFFKYNEHTSNTCLYARFTTKDMLEHFFNDLQLTTTGIDIDAVTQHIKEYNEQINRITENINILQLLLLNEYNKLTNENK